MNEINDAFKAVLNFASDKPWNPKDVKSLFTDETNTTKTRETNRAVKRKFFQTELGEKPELLEVLLQTYSDESHFNLEQFQIDLEKWHKEQAIRTDQDDFENIQRARPTFASQANVSVVENKGMQNQREDQGTFKLSISGEIVGASIIDCDNCFLKQHFKSGQQWDQKFGADKGATQMANKFSRCDELVWSSPFNINQESSNPIGWPKMHFEIIGKDWRGRDVHKGQGCINVPRTAGRFKRESRVFVPMGSDGFWDSIGSFFSFSDGSEGDNLMGKGRDITKVAPKGSITVNFNVMTRQMENLNQLSQ